MAKKHGIGYPKKMDFQNCGIKWNRFCVDTSIGLYPPSKYLKAGLAITNGETPAVQRKLTLHYQQENIISS